MSGPAGLMFVFGTKGFVYFFWPKSNAAQICNLQSYTLKMTPTSFSDSDSEVPYDEEI